jgi:hypothetical protein
VPCAAAAVLLAANGVITAAILSLAIVITVTVTRTLRGQREAREALEAADRA